MATAKSDAPQGPGPGSARSSWSTRRKVIVAAIVVVVVLALVAAAIIGAVLTNTTNTTNGKPGSGETGASETPSSASPVPSGSATPVPIASPGTITDGLTAAITKFEAVDGVAKTPGEVSGPSVRMTVVITNATTKAEALNAVNVTAYYGSALTPALELSEPGGAQMPTTVAAGKTATGVYVFTIPTDQRGNVRVEVDYSVKVKPLIFQGALPL
jgi:hypothetical protein